AQGCMSMMLTPKGWSVSSRQRRMWARSSSPLRIPPAPIRPSAPALEQAAANSPVAMFAIPPWIIGYFVPRISLSSFIVNRSPFCSCFCACVERITDSERHAGPGQPAAEADAGGPHAGGQLAGFGQFMQGHRHAGRAGVAEALHVFVKLGGVGLELFDAVVNDAAVRLVADHPVQIVKGEPAFLHDG